MKTLIAVLVVILAILATVMFTRNLAGKSALPFTPKAPTATLQINQQTITLDIASDEQSRQKGLSGRDKLASNAGMLFTFSKADYEAFWMKGMKFPIDMIFLNNKKVLTVFPNVPVPSSVTSDIPVYKSVQPSDMVIELPAGQAQALGIKNGSLLNLSL